MQKNLYSLDELKNILQQKSLKVLVVGDGCYDIYHYGYVNRISPEAPVPVFDHSYINKKNGMAFNVVENLRALGVHVDFHVKFTENKNRYIDIKTNYQLLRVDEKIDQKVVQSNVNLDLNYYDAIVISDYSKGFLSYEIIEDFRKRFKGPIFLDTKKTDLKRFEGCILKINEPEWLSRTSDYDNVVITCGSEPVRYKKKQYYPKKIDVHDVCGAGDTFLAALTYGYLQSDGNIDVGIEFAILASAIAVKHIGVYNPSIEEIFECG